ncbi:MAG: ABC transporter substrate-binding protein [Spirochaetia bacterium]
MHYRLLKILSILFVLSTLAAPVFAGGAGEAPVSESSGAPGASEASTGWTAEASIRYAEGFSVEYHDTFKVVDVTEPWMGADESFRYVLYKRGTEAPGGYPEALKIEVPIESIITMSTTYVSYLDLLGLLDTLVGMDSFLYVFNPEVREMIANGEIRETGGGKDVNLEIALDLEPDLIMTHAIGGDWDSHPKLLEAGFSVAMNGEYLERSPLARFEWIKYTALFYNAEEKAEEIFDETVRRYESLTARAREAEPKPTVLVNAPYQGVWWLPGGDTFAARFIKDAGAEYILADDETDKTHMLDIEAVFAQAGDADVWINTGMWNSLDEALAEDERFAEFEAIRSGRVFNNNARQTENGGNAYWESGITHPHVVLADLVKIFHPELVPDHEFVYYHKLD